MLRENDAGMLGQASTGYRLEETVGDGGALGTVPQGIWQCWP